MTFQYISDIHLEHYTNNDDIDKIIPKRHADYLILAGDIGYPQKDSYRYFLEKVSKIWKKIFLICGNHEYYQTNNKYSKKKNMSMDEIDEYITKLIKQIKQVNCDSDDNSDVNNNIIFLNNSKYELEIDDEKYILIGSPLFSHIPIEKRYIIQSGINDFKYIYIKEGEIYRNINIDDFNELHKRCVEYIQSELEFYKNTDYIPVVITHYAPTFQSIDDKYKDDIYNNAFYSDLEYLIKNDMYCWIHGHTHAQKELLIYDTVVVNNSIGYKSEKDKNIVLEKVV